MNKVKLSREEKELLEAVEAGEFESVLTESRKEELQSIARNTVKKDKRINIRILSYIKNNLLRLNCNYYDIVF